ncbi:hypothetical protein AC1031_001205 [Aphanomyces cochlioides]|nr:hypothetical protein AC1031_001205 [Aphanomyces cochlioides]
MDSLAIKTELERALNVEEDVTKWTKELYYEISVWLDKALESEMDDPQDKHGIGAATLVQAALRACTAFEKMQVKQMLSTSPSSEDLRICNTKSIAIDECMRILNGLRSMIQYTWNDTASSSERDGSFYQSKSIESRASEIRVRVIEVRQVYRSIDVDSDNVDECLHLLNEVTSKYDALESHISTDTVTLKQTSSVRLQPTVVDPPTWTELQLPSAQSKTEFEQGKEVSVPTLALDIGPQTEKQDEVTLAKGKSDDDKVNNILTPPSKLRAKREQRQAAKQRRASMVAPTERNQTSHDEPVSTEMVQNWRAAKFKAKSDAEKKKQEEVTKARADVDQGDDDSMEEMQRRADARKFLVKYDGDVWTATRTGRLDIVEKFFLVESTTKLLSLHDKNPLEGRRTLLHSAAWHGHVHIAKYLLRLGAEVDAVDTIHSKTTPLIEAARAGHMEMCQLLLTHGAVLTHQDAHGDTALHWAARRHWHCLAASMVKTTEQLHPKSTARVFSIENYQGFTVLEVGTPYLVDVAKKTFGVTAVVTREQRREAKRFGLKKMQRQSMRMVMPSVEHRGDGLDNIVQAKANVLDGLNKLGLGLESFAYTR